MQQIDDLTELSAILGKGVIEEIAVQSLDLSPLENKLLETRFSQCLFLGCVFTRRLLKHLQHDNFIFPLLNVPFHTYPSKLYNKETLYNGFDPSRPETYLKTLDKVIYDYYQETREELSIKDTLAQRLHDHSITDSLHEYISKYDERRLVAVMGGHNMLRTDATYLQVVRLSKMLAEHGYLMLSGGGPGAMEATHVGAWMAVEPIRSCLKQWTCSR